MRVESSLLKACTCQIKGAIYLPHTSRTWKRRQENFPFSLSMFYVLDSDFLRLSIFWYVWDCQLVKYRERERDRLRNKIYPHQTCATGLLHILLCLKWTMFCPDTNQMRAIFDRVKDTIFRMNMRATGLGDFWPEGSWGSITLVTFAEHGSFQTTSKYYDFVIVLFIIKF